MLWWPRRGEAEGDTEPELAGGSGGTAVATRERIDDETAEAVSSERIRQALDRLDVRYLADTEGSLLAMWERHALLIALEGPADEILVMRARPHATAPPDWIDRAYRVVNEWNHSRRFYKAYVGDPTERGHLPIYAEVQVPLSSGTHDALLDELIDCGVSVSLAFVDFLHEELL